MAVFTYVLLCVCVYLVHVLYFTVDVVFYAAIFDVFVALVVSSALFLMPFYSVFNRFEKVTLSVVFILIGYSLSISVPTVIDRSLSFYILEKLDQRGGIQLTRFEDVFTKEYAKEHHLVDVRLTEQLVSGTIVINNGCVKLTQYGRFLAHFSSYFRQNFLPKHRLLMGEYTDVLTDPFRDSDNRSDYVCN